MREPARAAGNFARSEVPEARHGELVRGHLALHAPSAHGGAHVIRVEYAAAQEIVEVLAEAHALAVDVEGVLQHVAHARRVADVHELALSRGPAQQRAGHENAVRARATTRALLRELRPA